MLGTILSGLLVLAAAGCVGQAILALSGRRDLPELAPAVGLAALPALAWAGMRLPGDATTALIVLALAVALAAAVLASPVARAGRAAHTEDPGGAGSPVAASPGLVALIAAAALLVALLPFAVEGRFGILGTGLNPDMSQHLFAADRLAQGATERLVENGYPLGPHSLAVAAASAGASLVAAFNGLMLAGAAATCLAAAALMRGLSAPRRLAGALVVGFAYLLASTYVQGALKETLEALYVLAFAAALHCLSRQSGGGGPGLLRALPLAVLAIGSAYAYSFPGLLWLLGAAGAWAALELAATARRAGPAAASRLARGAAPPALAALAIAVAGIAPELPRIVGFASFETFDPQGPGLGNLFDRLSPLEALGIWPSGDFRVEPGGGAAPAVAFYLGGALALAALGFGLRWTARRGELALAGALAAAAVLWLYALVAGTPYQEAKALVIAAPLAAALAARGLLAGARPALAAGYCLAAGGSAALALANGPVGPREYSPELAELRGELGRGSTLVLAPAELLDSEHGRDYLVWELRGNRVCVEERPAGEPPPLRPGIETQIAIAPGDAVAPEAVVRAARATGPGPCPLIPAAARADPDAAG